MPSVDMKDVRKEFVQIGSKARRQSWGWGRNCIMSL